jgi:hypothetical protein
MIITNFAATSVIAEPMPAKPISLTVVTPQPMSIYQLRPSTKSIKSKQPTPQQPTPQQPSPAPKPRYVSPNPTFNAFSPGYADFQRAMYGTNQQQRQGTTLMLKRGTDLTPKVLPSRNEETYKYPSSTKREKTEW